MEGVTIVDHPLVQHKLTLIATRSSTKSFRELLKRDRDAAVLRGDARPAARPSVEIETPLAHIRRRDRRQEAGVRADPALRHEASSTACSTSCRPRASPISASTAIRETFVAVEYFFKAPSDLAERLVIVVAPVLATANTAVAAIDRLKERGAKDIRFVCLLAAPEGLERLAASIPTCRSGPPRSTSGWTSTATSCRARRRRRPCLRHQIASATRLKPCAENPAAAASCSTELRRAVWRSRKTPIRQDNC